MFKLNVNEPLTEQLITKMINYHRGTVVPRLQKLDRYYLGDNDINMRQMQDPTKPNNKLANPFGSYITDTLTGYFIGEPVTYNSLDEAALQTLTMIYEYNDEQDENMELAKSCSIYGVAFELLYVDNDGIVRFKQLDTKECIPVYDDSIEEELLYLIRYYKNFDLITETSTLTVEIYSREDIKVYKGDEFANSLNLINQTEHYFKLCPVVIYKNNNEETGDYEKVISLIDAYDKLESDSLNDFEYFVDAYLVLHGMNAEAEDIKAMKENRVILMDADTSAEWLIKDANDGQQENMKNRIEQDIHKFSKCPDLSDDSFSSNASGVAIKYKMLGTENLISIKERKFKKGLQRRIELIGYIESIKNNNIDFRSFSITFTRNLPTNDTEIADVVNKLDGIVSKETLLSVIPFVTNIKDEIERLEKEKEANPFYDYNSMDLVQTGLDEQKE